jgi:hypothetical protein
MAENTAWQLEDFVDSLVVDLGKARETLAVRSLTTPLDYTVKELALDLNIFPSYDGDRVTFITAQPGQEGASKVTINLGSITDQQVRATSKIPGAKNDLSIDEIPIDKATKKQLRKLGVSSVGDLKQIEQKNVDLKKVTDNTIDYSALANQISKSKRDQTPPRVKSVSLSVDENEGPYLLIEGENLAIDSKFPPVAVINQTLAGVMSSSPGEVKIRVTDEHALTKSNEVILTFDPFALVRLNVKAQ